jgi:hypothetical protein
MEYHQVIQKRAGQTAAVINKSVPTLTVSGVNATGLLAQSAALDGLAQTRDNRLADSDAATNAENQGFLAIQALTLSLPHAAEADLDDNLPAESALLDLLAPVFAIKPRTTELALERGQKLVSALTKINAYLTALVPPRNPITSGGKGLTDLNTLIAAQPALVQAVEDSAANMSGARSGLRVAATSVDRLNKRFYAKLTAEARTNAGLADALTQIDTESANLPGTLGIKTVLQGGTDHLHILVSYDAGTYDGTATSTVEWLVVGVDTDITNHDVTADPSGNALGPFTVGSTVQLRTRVTNSNGTTTGSVRTLTLQ